MKQTAMKTSTLIALCSSLASVILSAEPPKPAQMHLIDRNRTNTPPTYRVSVDYDVYRVAVTYHVVRREPMRYDYRIALKPISN